MVFSEDKNVIEQTVNNIIEWLKAGSSDAKRPIDWDWDVDVKRSDEGVLIEAFHPKAYLKLLIYVNYEQYLVKMAVNPLYPTKFLDNDKRLRLYYELLKVNFGLPLVKASLFGEDDEVLFLVDLDARTLGKEEFNHALESLYYSVMAFAEDLGLEDEIMAIYRENVMEALLERLEKGESLEQLIDYLVSKVGMSRDKAEKFIEDLKYYRDQKESEREHMTTSSLRIM